MNAEQLKIDIDKWVVIAANLKHYKEIEELQRRAICNEIFGGRTTKGSDDAKVDGYSEVKATFVVNVKVDPAELNVLYAADKLTEVDMACFKSKIETVSKRLKHIADDSHIWGCIAKTPGMPKLEVVEIDNSDS